MQAGGVCLNVLFCVDRMVMGGTAKVLCHFLAKLSQYPGFSMTLVSRYRIRDLYFLTFLRQNGIAVCMPGRMDIHPRFFIVKILTKPLRKLVISLFFKRARRIFKHADVIIDFDLFSFADQLRDIKVPKITWAHSSFNFFYRYGVSNMEHYDRIVCLSDAYKADFIRAYPQYADKVRRIYNPIDADALRNSADTGINPCVGKYFVHVSRLDYDKDVETVIRAFEIFSKENPDVRLYIVGDGPHLPRLKQLASGNPNIVFTGRIYNPAAIIRDAIALILSSTTTVGEGLPVTIQEAHVLGTVAISSDVPSGPREMLMDGQAGLLFPAGDAHTLAKLMDDVYNNRVDVAAIRDCATRNLSRFEPDDITAQVVNLIKEVIK